MTGQHSKVTSLFFGRHLASKYCISNQKNRILPVQSVWNFSNYCNPVQKTYVGKLAKHRKYIRCLATQGFHTHHVFSYVASSKKPFASNVRNRSAASPPSRSRPSAKRPNRPRQQTSGVTSDHVQTPQ